MLYVLIFMGMLRVLWPIPWAHPLMSLWHRSYELPIHNYCDIITGIWACPNNAEIKHTIHYKVDILDFTLMVLYVHISVNLCESGPWRTRRWTRYRRTCGRGSRRTSGWSSDKMLRVLLENWYGGWLNGRVTSWQLGGQCRGEKNIGRWGFWFCVL